MRFSLLILEPSLLGALCMMTILLSVFQGCAHRITLKTEPPGASVRTLGEGGKSTLLPGVTPLEVTHRGENEISVFEFRKEGFLPKQALVTPPASAKVDVLVALQPLSRTYLAETARKDFSSSLNENLARIFKLQTLVLAKDKEGVARMEASMKAEWNDVSLYHSLLGNHLFLLGDKKGARLRYERALSLDPSNEEALAMIARLR